MFLASIAALATTAPAGSEIVPVIVPRSLWANAAEAQRNRHTTPATWRMEDLPLHVVGQTGSLGHRPALMLVGSIYQLPGQVNDSQGN